MAGALEPVADAVRKAGSKQFLNHLDGLQCIGRKNELYVNLRSYRERERLDALHGATDLHRVGGRGVLGVQRIRAHLQSHGHKLSQQRQDRRRARRPRAKGGRDG